MADEYTIESKVTFSKGGTTITMPAADDRVLSFDVTGSVFTHQRQSIGTSAENVNVGEVTLGGWAYIINHDATNYVELIDSGAGSTFATLEAGEVFMGRINAAVTLQAQANTAACEIEYLIVDD